MVRGLDKFSEFFKDHQHQYIIIGGTACDIILDAEGFDPRVTKDIDMILILEALDSAFGQRFWQFIDEGGYERKEKDAAGRKYYRFSRPEQPDFPQQIELFARRPEIIAFDEDDHLTPVPLDDDLSSLSAILLDDDYYHYMIEHSEIRAGVHCANPEALVCLKAKAFLDISDRIAKGGGDDKKHAKKHKEDIFRIGLLFQSTDSHVLPERLKADLQLFMDTVIDELPDKEIFKRMGIPDADPRAIYDTIIEAFRLVKQQ